jgi:hypothetical protein
VRRDSSTCEALLIPQIAKGRRAIRLPAGVLPINHKFSVVATAPGVELDTIAAALADPVADPVADASIRQHATSSRTTTARLYHDAPPTAADPATAVKGREQGSPGALPLGTFLMRDGRGDRVWEHPRFSYINYSYL